MRNLQEAFDACTLNFIFNNEYTKEDQSNWDDHCEESGKLEWQFCSLFGAKVFCVGRCNAPCLVVLLQ